MQCESAISFWNVINNIASTLGIISAFVTIIAALKTKKYAESIIKAYEAEALVIASEKLDQAKNKYLEFRKIQYGNKRGVSQNKIQKELAGIESLLDEVEKNMPTDNVELQRAIADCKSKLNDYIANQSQDGYQLLGLRIDNARNQFRKALGNERKGIIRNLKQ